MNANEAREKYIMTNFRTNLDWKPMKEITCYFLNRRDGKSSSALISYLLYLIFIKTVHEMQSMFGNLPDFISYLRYEK